MEDLTVETDSLNKAAYLTYKGHRVTIVNGSPVRFIFAPEATKDADEYDAGALVPAAIYADCVARLRRLSAERRSGR